MKTMNLNLVASGMIMVTVLNVVKVITWMLNNVTHVLMAANGVQDLVLINAQSAGKDMKCQLQVMAVCAQVLLARTNLILVSGMMMQLECAENAVNLIS